MRTALPVVALLALLTVGGCATHPGRAGWGSGATLAPGWDRIGRAARDAATEPSTWVPSLGAVILLAGDFDHEISEWAVERQPLFGRDAESASYDLRDATTAAWLVTLLAADSGGADFGETIRNKGAAAAVELAAVGVSEGLTWGLKEATGRERPNGANDKSFVSGHASAAATRAALAARNLDHVDLPDWGRTGLKIGFHALALGSAWARVEAEKHYPSDVLAGAALGNFVANFMVNAFLEPGDAVISVTPLDGGAMFTLKSRF